MRSPASIAGAAILITMLVAASSCSKGEVAPASAPVPTIASVTPEDWRRLASLRIVFGHQSVGQDIVHGLSDVMKENPAIQLTVATTATPGQPALVHFAVGKNEQPLTKIDHFKQVVDSTSDAPPDIALMKFCYIDTTANTDAEALFRRYRDTVAELRARHPQITFLHVTMPLRVVQTGWKAQLKGLIGRPIGGYAENVKRNQYNDLMRAEYQGKEPLFDLAALESTRPDGQRASFVQGDTTYFALAPEYTYDGGHLNERGRRYVAEGLLATLADVARARPSAN